MRILIAPLALAALLMGSAAGHAAPASKALSELVGHWSFLVTTGAGVTRGQMRIEPSETNMTGTVTTERGNEIMPVRAVIRNGDHIEILVGSPRGDVVFGGALANDARSFEGTVLYHDGQRFPMSGQRVQR